jgi:hypothetical protein
MRSAGVQFSIFLFVGCQLLGRVQASDFNVIQVLVAKRDANSAMAVAAQRLEDYSAAKVEVNSVDIPHRERDATLVVRLGVKLSPRLTGAPQDSYLVETVSQSPLTIVATGANDRGMLYAAYLLADLLKAKADLTDLDLLYQPKVEKRYVSFGATTHGRKVYRPELYWQSLHELPRYGYNGVVLYPGGGTPIGRHASPIVEGNDGSLRLEPENTAKWQAWLSRIEPYGLETMMTVPPVVPPGYSKRQISDYYAGGSEPKDYRKNLQQQFRKYLELLTAQLPSVDMYMFNSTEGATFGNNVRFFGHPAPHRYSSDKYLANNAAVMRAYFDVLTEFFREDMDKVCFWTHSFGITSEGIVKMREVLLEYPEVTILEDDFWNNNLWPFDLPAMNYLPQELRQKVSQTNPFGLFQIGTDGEYYGGGSLPNADPTSRIRSANEAVERDARMVIQRLDLHARTSYGTAFGTMEIIPLAASKQLWSPTPAIKEIWRHWAERRFGKKAAPNVIEALQQSRTVLIEGLSGDGIDLLAVGQNFTPRLWKRDGSGLTRFYLFGKPNKPLLDKTEGETVLSPEYTIYQMNSHSIPIETFRQNQERARQAVEKGLGLIEQAKPHLTGADYTMLREVFLNGRHVLKAVRLLGEAAYATNIVLDNFDNVEQPQEFFETSIDRLEAYLNERSLDAEMTQNLQEIVDSYKQVARTQDNAESR